MPEGSAEALLLETFGTRLLAYLCAVEESAIEARIDGKAALPPRAEGVLQGELIPIALHVAGDPARHPHIHSLLLVGALSGRHEASATSIGNAIRLAAGGALPQPPSGPDHLGNLFCQLAIDQYPVFLVEKVEAWHPLGASFSTWPLSDELHGFVLADPDLSHLFPSDDPGVGRCGFIFSGNRGTSIRVSFLAACFSNRRGTL
jgi:hypothetical protein